MICLKQPLFIYHTYEYTHSYIYQTYENQHTHISFLTTDFLYTLDTENILCEGAQHSMISTEHPEERVPEQSGQHSEAVLEFPWQQEVVRWRVCKYSYTYI